MLTAAAVVLVLLGLLHSVLGEILVFRRLSGAQGVPSLGFPPLVGGRDSAVPTMRACWHLLTVFGWTSAWLIARLGALPELGPGDRTIVQALALSLGACAVVMLVGTRARHLGWIGFLAAAALAWLGVS
jgi:hypothetical protein